MDIKDSLDITVVGSGGYIGRTLVKYLVDVGHNVDTFDIKDEGVSIQDENNAISWTDAIIFLAAFPGAEACKSDPKRAVRDNIAAPIVTAYNELVSYTNSTKFIFASSLGARDPFQNFYVTTKWIVEQELMRMSEVHNVDIRILRFANVYGGSDYLNMKNSVIAKFAKMKMKDEMIVVAGDGKQKRDFIHLYDVCEAVRLCVEADVGYSLPVEIGTGKGTSVEDLAKMFNHKFTFDPQSDMIGTKDSIADTGQAKKLWGFEAKRKLEDYMKGV